MGGIGIPESSWILYAIPFNSYLHSHRRKVRLTFKQWKKLPNMEQAGDHKTLIFFHEKERGEMQMFRRENALTRLL